jgi:peptide deformylase
MKLVAVDDSVLFKPAMPVDNISDQVLPWIDRMRGFMARRGIALAAPQIGVSLRFFVYGGFYRAKGFTVPHGVAINPEITWRSDDVRTDIEGCLSNPGYLTAVCRPESIRCTWTDEVGNRNERKLLGGFMARLFQHEIDHLDGIVIWRR